MSDTTGVEQRTHVRLKKKEEVKFDITICDINADIIYNKEHLISQFVISTERFKNTRMAKSLSIQPISEALIVEKIFIVRGFKIMLDNDLDEMYGVETRVLNQAVTRNTSRFPSDFMFQLSDEEWNNLKSQFVTSKKGGIRKLPFAFTEQGVAMLSSVLRSEIAIQVNIQIIRVYTRMKEIFV